MNSNEEKIRTLYRDFDLLLKEIYPLEEKIPVFGEGNTQAKVILVGEAPGAQETLQRRPFVGSAGKNLNEILELIALNRADIYVTNVVKFRPYKVNEKTGRLSNRPPTLEEVSICAHVLNKEIEIIQPAVVMTLGNFALRAVTDNKNVVIGDVHGQLLPMEKRNYSVYPMYHPAGMIYNRALKSVFRQDGLHFAEILQQIL